MENPKSISMHDASKSLSVYSYYLLVLFSFTGLCTLLGLTETVEKKEWVQNANEKGRPSPDLCVWPRKEDDQSDERNKISRSELLKSKLDSTIEVNDLVFEYIERHITNQKPKQPGAGEQQQQKRPMIYLRRAFEYHFQLVSLHVIMVHFSTFNEQNGEEVLHLVEVYRFNNKVLRNLFRGIFDLMANALKCVYGEADAVDQVKID